MYKIIYMVLVAWFLVGCANTSNKSTSEVLSETNKSYGLFYNQGDHINDLINSGNLDAASSIYREHKENYFSLKENEHKDTLDNLATNLKSKYKDRFDRAELELKEAKLIAADFSSWPKAKEVIINTKELLEDFAVHDPVFQGSRHGENRDRLSNLLEERTEEWRGIAKKAFSWHNLKRLDTNFFDVFPVDPHDARHEFLERVISSSGVEALLVKRGPKVILSFANTYKDEISSSDSLNKHIANMFVKSEMRLTSNEDSFAVAINAIKKARENGLKISKIPNLSIGIIEIESKALLSSGQIEFPVDFDIDLPFNTEKTTFDDVKRVQSKQFDYLLVLEVSQARTNQVIEKREKQNSQFLSGYRDLPNPAYEPARMAVYQAQNAVAQNQGLYCHGAACIGKLVAAVALAGRLKEANEKFVATPMMITHPVYQDYEFNVSDVDAIKLVTAHYYVIDLKHSRYIKSTYDISEKKQFRIAYNLHDKDRNLSSHLNDYENEETVSKFSDTGVTIKLSDILNKTSQGNVFHNRFVDIRSLQNEMSEKRNITLAAYQTRNLQRSATVNNDSRFESVVEIINPTSGIGSGFFVEPNLVLTNYHVIEGAKFIQMKLYNGQITSGTVIKSDVRHDLALIKTQARGFPVVFHNGSIQIGQTVEAIGHPKGLSFTITRGIVSALRPLSSVYDVGGKKVLFVQTDAPLNSGNSGGPLFQNGQVIGINDVKIVAKDVEGISFSIHYSEALDFLNGRGI